MPNIQPTKQGGKIIFDTEDWLSGLAPQGGQGSGTIVKGKGAAHVERFDPYRNYGWAQPGYGTTNVSNMSNISGTIKAEAVKTSSKSYLIASDGEVHVFDYSTSTIDSTHPLDYASATGEDIIIYKHNRSSVSQFSAFYSFYSNAHGGDVGAHDNLATYDDDFMSTIPSGATTLSSSVPHPMCIGADGVLYIGDGNLLHGYDGATGADGTLDGGDLPLTLPPGFVITSLLRDGDFLWIGGFFTATGTISNVYDGQGVIYLWNYIDQRLTKLVDAEDNYVASIFKWRGRRCCITQGEDGARGRLRLKFFSIDGVEDVAEFDGTAPVFRGVDASGKQLLINLAGKIWSVGSYVGGYEVNHLWTSGLTSSSGVILNHTASGAGFFASGGSELVRLNGWGIDARWESATFSPIFPPGYHGKIKHVSVFFKGTASLGHPLTIQVYTDGQNNSGNVLSAKTSVAYPFIKHSSSGDNTGEYPAFKDIALVLIWGSTGAQASVPPVVDRVEIDYDLVPIEEGNI